MKVEKVNIYDNKYESGFCMTEKEIIQRNIEEFSRLQDYMIDSDKESNSYKR